MLEIENLTVHYGSRLALDGISLTVAAGEVLAVIGPNGAGKSSLVKAVSHVLRPSAGTVRVAGQDVGRLTPAARARLLAVAPQARSLPGDFTVFETVLLGRTAHLNWLGQATGRDRELTQQALARTCTDHLAARRVGRLSGGEQQRVLLARALAQDAPLLLLDEPTTHLDLQHQSGLLNLVRGLARERDLAVLIVLHDLNLASLYADRVALLVAGRLHALGTPRQVLTSATLSGVFHVPVNVTTHPDYDTPLILPDGLERRPLHL
jgi:iron complex transport system ATP-binding protein